MELKIGKKYRVKHFAEIPDEWDEDYYMANFTGKIVTISSINDNRIRVEEAPGWVWSVADFESAETDWDE